MQFTIRHFTSILVVMLHLCPLRSTDRVGMEPRYTRATRMIRPSANMESVHIM